MIDTSDWSPDWADRLRHAVRSHGFDSVTGLLASMPARPYCEVTARLGQIAPIQLIAMQFREARAVGCVRDAAKDSGRTSPHVQIFGWRLHVMRGIPDSDIQAMASRIFTELTIANPPPVGWRPETDNDPLINQLFDRFWPTESRTEVP